MKTLAPVVLFCYNRPEHLRRTVEALRANELAGESSLFVFSDGPKNPEAEPGVRAVRKYIHGISGFRSVEIRESETNRGLAASVISGVTEIVNRFGKIIVLEDDMVTSPFFLRYMNDSLDAYENEDRVVCIHAHMFPGTGLPPYFFLRHTGCWGWGTWKRGWALFDPDSGKLLRELRERHLEKTFDMDGRYPYTEMLRRQSAGEIDSWAIRWEASAFLQGKLGLFPGTTFLHNIGTDAGVHCSGMTANINGPFPERYAFAEIPPRENREARKIYGKMLETMVHPKICSRTAKLFHALKNAASAPKSAAKEFLRLAKLYFHTLLDEHYVLGLKYGKIPRFVPHDSLKLGKYTLSVPDVPSVLYSYRELFRGNIYHFPAKGGAPVVVDLGANVGLSVIYTKSVYPDAEIYAYEADPKIYGYLCGNLKRNGITDVRTFNAAVWNSDGVIHFASEGADGGAVDKNGIEVKSTDILSILGAHEKIDFLKMDVEGAENTILPRMDGHLSNVDCFFLEYHSAASEQQKLGGILDILARNGFRYRLFNLEEIPEAPFLSGYRNGRFDLQMNIFAVRAGASSERQ